jgi:hypothetical protein
LSHTGINRPGRRRVQCRVPVPSAIPPVAGLPGHAWSRTPRRSLSAWLILLLLLAPAVGRAQSPAPPEAPLPDLVTLAREVRARLEPDSALLRQYTYRERRRDVKVSKLGKVQLGPWREFEVYPSTVRGETYKRLVAVDGKPLSAAELERRDAAHRKHVLDRHAQLEAESPADREKRLAKATKERREEQETVDEAFRVLEPSGLRRVQLDGRPTLVVDLTPRPGVQPRTDAGKYMSRMQGTVWINEADRQVVRVEMEVIRDITFGLGILARLHTGSEMTFRRSLVNGEIWLPAEATFKAAGRAVLFRRFDVETTTRYSDYRKFNVSTSEDVVGTAHP